MFRKVTLALVLIMLFALPCMAQVSAYGVLNGGALIEKNQTPTFSLFAGANVPVKIDKFKTGDTSQVSYELISQTGVFYADRDGDREIQGLSEFLLSRRHFQPIPLTVAVGGGVLYRINEGQDNGEAALKLELGWNLKVFSVTAGAIFVPIRAHNDQYVFYGGIDLL